MTTIPSSSLPDEWEDLLAWIVRQLTAIPVPSATIPDEWKMLILWIISELEANFSRAHGAGGKGWEERFRNAHERSKETLDAGAEKVIDHVKEMPEGARGPAAAWWEIVWRKITEFATKMINYVIRLAQTVWERVKAWFARLKRAIANAWARWTSSGRGQVPLRC